MFVHCCEPGSFPPRLCMLRVMCMKHRFGVGCRPKHTVHVLLQLGETQTFANKTVCQGNKT